MHVASKCPECNRIQLKKTRAPPEEHEYEGWITHVDCTACEFDAYAPELT
jgi:hypothetical protein